MAGGNRSYWRKKGTSGDIKTAPYTTLSARGPGGEMQAYKVYELYQYNPGESQPVMDSDGRCVSRPGSDAEYYEQGPDGDNTRTLNATITGIGSDGKPETYSEFTGSAGFQVNHPNDSVSDKF